MYGMKLCVVYSITLCLQLAIQKEGLNQLLSISGQDYPDLDKYGLTIGLGAHFKTDDPYTRKVLKDELQAYYRRIQRARLLDPEKTWVSREKSGAGTVTSQELVPSEESDQHYPQGQAVVNVHVVAV